MALTKDEEELLERLIAEEAAAQQAAPGGDGESWLRGAGRAFFGQGAGGGFGDEIAGGFGALVSRLDPELRHRPMGEVYTDIRDAEREAQRRFGEENPLTNIALQGAGTLLTAPAAAAKAPAAIQQSFRAMGAIPRTIAAGATGGAVEALGRSEAEGAAAVARDVGLGASLGGVTGPLGAGATALAGKALGAGWNRLVSSAGPRGRRAVEKVLESEGSNVDEVIDFLEEFPGNRPADFPGLQMAASESVSRKAAKELLDARLAAQPGRIIDAATGAVAATGAPVAGRKQAFDSIVKAQRAASKPRYEAAYQQPLPRNPAILDAMDELLERPTVKRAYAEARKDALDEGEKVPQKVLMKGSDDPEEWTWKEVPNWREWDLIQRGLRKLADSAGKNPERLADARRYRRLRRELLDVLDPENPQLRDARHTYAGYAAVREALDEGRGLFRRGVDVDEIAEKIENMSDGELMMFRTGVLQAIRDVAQNTPESRNLLYSMLNTEAAQTKLRLAIGAEGAEAVMRELAGTGEQIGASRVIAQGSKTAPQTAAREIMRGAEDANIPGAVMSGSPAEMLRATARSAMPPSLSPAARERIGAALMDPAEFQRLMMHSRVGATPWTHGPGLPLVSGAFGGAIAPYLQGQ